MTQDRAGLPRLGDAELLQLRRWNTPTIYNGWEQITRQDAGKDGFNVEEVCDFMPQMGPMCGYAVTAVFEPSNPEHAAPQPQRLERISPLRRRRVGARRSSSCRTSTSPA